VKTTELKATSNAKNPQNVRVVCVCVFLALAVLAVFGQTARFGFVNYDDEVYVYENPMVQNGPLRECSGVFSLGRIEVQATQVEKDVVFESFFVPIAKRLFDQSLDFVV